MARVAILLAAVLTLLLIRLHNSRAPATRRVARSTEAAFLSDPVMEHEWHTPVQRRSRRSPRARLEQSGPVWAFWMDVARSNRPGLVALGYLNEPDSEIQTRAIFVIRRHWPTGSKRALIRLMVESNAPRPRFFAAHALLRRAKITETERDALRSVCGDMYSRFSSTRG